MRDDAVAIDEDEEPLACPECGSPEVDVPGERCVDCWSRSDAGREAREAAGWEK